MKTPLSLKLSVLPGISIFLLLLFSQCSKSDGANSFTTITGNVILPSQESVDSFVRVYRKYSSLDINGNLLIGSLSFTNNIKDISKLDKIKSLTGELGIVGTQTLNSLTGLQNITSVNNLYIFSNQSIINLNGLGSLKTIKGFFYLEVNEKLSSLNGLQNLSNINGAFKLTNGFFGGSQPNNPALVSLSLPSLKKIGGDFDLNNINPVTSLSFPKLDSVGGYLSINQANKLPDFTGLDSLKYIGGVLSITQSLVGSFKGFNNLKKIGGAIHIHTNPNITDMNGFSSLRDIGTYISISLNENLASLNGLESLRTATIIDVEYNKKLKNFCAIKPLIQNMLQLYPASSPFQLFVLNDNSNELPYPYYHSNVLNTCP